MEKAGQLTGIKANIKDDMPFSISPRSSIG